METGEIRMEKSEKKMSMGMKVLSGLTIVSGAVEVIYRVAGELGAERGMSWQVWVTKVRHINLTMILPLLLLLLAWAALNRGGKRREGWGMKLLAVGMASVYLFWLLLTGLYSAFAFGEERRLVGDLLLSNEATFLEENVWRFYRSKGIFFRVPGELEDADRQRYLEEKYGGSFTVLEEKDGYGRNLFGDESHPGVSVKVTLEGWELKDNYAAGLAVYYLEEGYRELGLVRPAEIRYTGPYFYLALEDEADIDAFSEDASRLMQYVVSQTPFFEEYYGFLYFIHMEGRQEVTGGLPFGSLVYASLKADYWAEPESVAEYVAERYAEGAEHANWLEMYEALAAESREADSTEQSDETDIRDQAMYRVYEDELVNQQEEAAQRIYEEVLEEQGYSYEVCYNAKGNLYIDLGQRPAGQEGDSETEGFYRMTLVYDRLSKNGACELFVLYKEHQRETETGTVGGNPAIVNFYAVETQTGRVIAADKTGWAELGCAEYREATGE